jgi:cation diffusion facilitator CzcD-associated flavoprotein CzcO
MSERACVIGAGVAGLTALKHCLEEGFDTVCFEKDTDVGGLWNYHDKNKFVYFTFHLLPSNFSTLSTFVSN